MRKTNLDFTTYCNNHMAHLNAAFYSLPNGRGVYYLDGQHYSIQEFNELYPIKGKLVSAYNQKHLKGENIDPITKWMNQ